MSTLNLGILAHVDAGKTSLTERLLYAAGAIDAVGSVDAGSTQTDTLALERQRGITIKAAVAAFAVDGVAVNLIDTPGHPDFIAEVERALGVLDGAVLVVAAVEGVQPQTRVLLRTLRRLRLPTVLFVNKIDRPGAQPERVLGEIATHLTPAAVPMGAVRGAGTRGAAFVPYGAADAAFTARLAEVLAEGDEALLAAYVDAQTVVPYARLRGALAAQTRRAQVHPVFFGSALTGAGIAALLAGLVELLPPAGADAAGPVSGTVFKVERGPAGEPVAYVRLFSGTVRTRDRLPLRGAGERKVTAIRRFDGGTAAPCEAVAAGQIGKLWGLGDVRIGDPLGRPPPAAAGHHFAPPTLETVVVPRRPEDRGALHVALSRLAEQDPLINLRQDDTRRELFVSLYGEVQKEVIQATLAADFGVDVEFRESTTICVERPVGVGAAVELMGKRPNPFRATVGLRIAPAPAGSGAAFRPAGEVHGTMPLAFFTAVEDTVQQTLRQGLCGWQVTDCAVVMTHSGYSSVMSTAGDFRKLTPLVLMAALRRAGTRVHEPLHRFRLELPADTLGAVVPLLARLRAVPQTQEAQGTSCVLEGEVPAARAHELQQRLPALTRGEGVLECAFDHYRPVSGPVPTRPRTDHNPLNRKEYLLHVVRRV
ncbi:MAG TPA: translation factor GTPase family protein [Chloroflexota bacterium]|nr:translation factor GTPase family protein [Chloroflexota bacterium]